MNAEFNNKRCPVSKLAPGMELGQTLYSANGLVWLIEGTVLNAESIRRLQALSLNSVIIREYRPVEVNIEREDTVVRQPLEFVIAPSPLKRQVDGEYETVLAGVERLFAGLRMQQTLDAALLEQLSGQILAWSTRGAFIANFLLMASPRREYLVQHSVHVSAIGGVIGTLLELPGPEQRELVVCGLLHDVGFLTGAAAELTAELEDDPAHPIKGFQLLQPQALGQRVLYGILQHHERCDGSGYPLGASGDKIHRLAKIIAVADAYDALLAGRDREPASPFQVMQRLREEMLGRLDPAACACFLEYLTKVMIGNIALLSDGVKAQVVYWQPAAPQPVVRKDNGQFIDLAKQKALSIVKIIGA
ncbi:MAG: HD domain-containing protein [Sporomusaceae bacterium]|nr:HD domain-containing protein [Sporomusaceae bacterium]